MKSFSKIDTASAKQIAYWITGKGATRHLLVERVERLRQATKREINNKNELRDTLEKYLINSKIYFSCLRISPFHNTPENISPKASETSQEILYFLTEAAKRAKDMKDKINIDIKIPLQLVSHQIKQCLINDKMYIYCIKDKHVLVMAGKIKGNLSPNNFADVWHLSFGFTGITFLNFEDTADFIVETIKNNQYLSKYNMLMLCLLPVFKAQAGDIEQHYIEQSIDDEALLTLNENEKKLLGIYMPIFDRYGDADQRILKQCEYIFEIYKKNYSQKVEYIIFSPSYCLPSWFKDFFNYLSLEEQKILEELDLNKWSEKQLMKVISLLENFIEFKK